MDNTTTLSEFRRNIMSFNGDFLKTINYISNFDELEIDWWKFAISYCPMVIDQILDPTEELCLYAVERDPDMLDYISAELQTTTVCLAAVSRDGMALQHVKNQTPEICLAAVRNNGFAISLVEDPTHEIITAAYEQNPNAVRLADGTFPTFLKKTPRELIQTLEEQIREAKDKRTPDNTLPQKQEETLSI